MSTERGDGAADATVVGAGIAGCLAALSLRQVFDRVMLVARPAPTREDFPLTVGPGLVDELRALGLRSAWDAWTGKTVLRAQWSGWGSPHLERSIAMIPGESRHRVGRAALERFLADAVQQRGIACAAAAPRPAPRSVLVDATGRSGQIARRRGACRRSLAPPLLALHGVGSAPDLPDASTIVLSDDDGWWFAIGEQGQARLTYFSTAEALRGPGGRPAGAPPALAARVGTARMGIARCGAQRSLAAMSWLEHCSADGWFAVGDAALALDPVLGSGVEVAAESSRRLREALRERDPHRPYNAAMTALVARHRIARQRLYARAAAVHGGAFWQGQLQL